MLWKKRPPRQGPAHCLLHHQSNLAFHSPELGLTTAEKSDVGQWNVLQLSWNLKGQSRVENGTGREPARYQDSQSEQQRQVYIATIPRPHNSSDTLVSRRPAKHQPGFQQLCPVPPRRKHRWPIDCCLAWPDLAV